MSGFEIHTDAPADTSRLCEDQLVEAHLLDLPSGLNREVGRAQPLDLEAVNQRNAIEDHSHIVLVAGVHAHQSEHRHLGGDVLLDGLIGLVHLFTSFD